jgi:hypothetical protein
MNPGSTALVAWRRVVLGGLGCLLAGCVEPFAGTYRFEVPLAYQAAWDSVEACSGLSGDMARVRWYAVPQTTFFVGKTETFGAWTPPHTIYVAEWAKDDSLGHYLTVRHEMLHDLLGGGAEGQAHPPVFRTCHLMIS